MLLKLSHVRQRQQADCLAACAAMVLDYLGVSIAYNRIVQMLGTTAAGTPFHRLERLQSPYVRITRGQGSLAILNKSLASGFPVIVDVYTPELPYWQLRTDIPESEKATTHALVVVGIDAHMIYVHDPDFGQAPQVIASDDFELAWLERDYRFAIISTS